MMTPSGFRAKLASGRALLAKAQSESDVQLAFIRVHAALEDYLRYTLGEMVKHGTCTLSENAIGGFQWRDLATTAQDYRILSARQKSTALEANGRRIAIAHGDDITLPQAEVEAYALFVTTLVERAFVPPQSPAKATPKPIPDPTAQPKPRASRPPPQPHQVQQQPLSAPPAPPRTPYYAIIGIVFLLVVIGLLLSMNALNPQQPSVAPARITVGPLPTLMPTR